MATRQTSSSGRPKSPRIQVVLSEELLERLGAAAEADCRTVSNMAKLLIQQGLERMGRSGTEAFRQTLEQQRQQPGLLRGAPRRLRLRRPL